MTGRRMTGLPLAALLLVLVAACSEEIPVKDLPPQMVLETYAKGAKISARNVGPGDPAYARLRELITKERTGWDVTHAAMANGGYVFRSPTLTVNCFPNWIVLTYVEKGSSVQVLKKFENVPQRLGLPPAG